MNDLVSLDQDDIEMPLSPNNYDPDKWTKIHGLACKDPSLTQQQFAEESDINFIAERYGLTGEMPQVLQVPQYGDFTEVFDFQSAQDSVIRAREQFMSLPAKLRARFDNNPQRLLEFLGDEDNRAEAEFLGLVTKRGTNDAGTDQATPRPTQEQAGSTGTATNTGEPQTAEKP